MSETEAIVRPEPCASTDPSHTFDHRVIEDAAYLVEALSDLLRCIVVDVDPCMDGPRPRVVSNRLTPEQGVLLQRVLDGNNGSSDDH